jgi:hypothetical protein
MIFVNSWDKSSRSVGEHEMLGGMVGEKS